MKTEIKMVIGKEGDRFIVDFDAKDKTLRVASPVTDMANKNNRRAALQFFMSQVAFAIRETAFPADTPIYETKETPSGVTHRFKCWPEDINVTPIGKNE